MAATNTEAPACKAQKGNWIVISLPGKSINVMDTISSFRLQHVASGQCLAYWLPRPLTEAQFNSLCATIKPYLLKIASGVLYSTSWTDCSVSMPEYSPEAWATRRELDRSMARALHGIVYEDNAKKGAKQLTL